MIITGPTNISIFFLRTGQNSDFLLPLHEKGHWTVRFVLCWRTYKYNEMHVSISKFHVTVLTLLYGSWTCSSLRFYMSWHSAMHGHQQAEHWLWNRTYFQVLLAIHVFELRFVDQTILLPYCCRSFVGTWKVTIPSVINIGIPCRYPPSSRCQLGSSSWSPSLYTRMYVVFNYTNATQFIYGMRKYPPPPPPPPPLSACRWHFTWQ